MQNDSTTDTKPSALALRIAREYHGLRDDATADQVQENERWVGNGRPSLPALIDAEIAPLVEALRRAEFAVEERWRREADPVKRSGLRDDVDAVREALARVKGGA